MSEDKFSYRVAFIVGCIVGVLFGALGAYYMCDYWRTECVRRGAAEWVVEDNGDTEFRWVLEPKENP